MPTKKKSARQALLELPKIPQELLNGSLPNSAITWAIHRARSARRMKPISAMARGDWIFPATGMAVFPPILIPKHERRYIGFDEKSSPCMPVA